MQIVIDIPEVFYEYCKAEEGAIEVHLAIKNGIVLPKGHGDLVDLKEMANTFWDGNFMEIWESDLEKINVVVKADTEVADGDSN